MESGPGSFHLRKGSRGDLNRNETSVGGEVLWVGKNFYRRVEVRNGNDGGELD